MSDITKLRRGFRNVSFEEYSYNTSHYKEIPVSGCSRESSKCDL